MGSIEQNGVRFNDVITVEYTGELNNGRIVVSSQIAGRLTFRVGAFQTIQEFNKVVLGMKLGETRECVFDTQEDVKEQLVFEGIFGQLLSAKQKLLFRIKLVGIDSGSSSSIERLKTKKKKNTKERRAPRELILGVRPFLSRVLVNQSLLSDGG